MFIVLLILFVYLACLITPIFVLPVINYLFLKNVQDDIGKLKGYFLLKTLLIFQPTIIIVFLFVLSIVEWRVVNALSSHLPYETTINIIIFNCILGICGLFFLLVFIRKQLYKMYCLKLNRHSLSRDIAIYMTKEGVVLVHPIIYFAFIFIVPLFSL